MHKEEETLAREDEEKELAELDKMSKNFGKKFSTMINLFHEKHFEFTEANLWMKFNSYGHLLEIERVGTSMNVSQLESETVIILQKVNKIVERVGEKIYTVLGNSLTGKLSKLKNFLIKDEQNDQEKLVALQEKLEEAFVSACDKNSLLRLEMNLARSEFQIKVLVEDLSVDKYVSAFAEAYYKISLLLYRNTKNLLELMGNDSMSKDSIHFFKTISDISQFSENGFVKVETISV